MNPTDLLSSILIRAAEEPKRLADQDRHVLYQVLIQHGLTVETSEGITSSLPTSEHFGSNPFFIQRSAAEKFSQIFFRLFSSIINVLACEIQFYERDKKNFDLVKEALSALSYLFSGFWISESLRKNLKTEASVNSLLCGLLKPAVVGEQVLSSLKSSLLWLSKLENREVQLILLFLLSKQQASTFFQEDIASWLQFLYKMILQFCRNASSSSSLYQQVQLFCSSSNEVIHCLEGFETIFSALTESSESNAVEDLVIPENILLFFLNQFFSLNDFKGKKRISDTGNLTENNEHNMEDSKTEEILESQEETERLLVSIICSFPSASLKNHLALIISRYCLIAPKFS
jgi:hypothetical protein